MPAPATTSRVPQDEVSSFFVNAGLRDPFSGAPGYFLTAEILLHECFHAIDDVSGKDEFASLAGFVRSGARWRFAVETEHDIAMIMAFDQELRNLGPSANAAAA